MAGDADLSRYGLARCRRCHRIVLAEHLEKGRCRPGNDCAAAEAIRRAWEDGHPDSLAFAAAVERGMR